MVIIVISIIDLNFDSQVKYQGFFNYQTWVEYRLSLLFSMNIVGALQLVVSSSLFALVMTDIFDATETILAVAG